MKPQRADILGLLLAGGQARRMGGGDKCLQELGGKTLLKHAIDRLAPQLDRLILNANGDGARFADYGLPVVGDVIPDFAGPLAGILTGLEWAAENAPAITHVLSVPTDAPFLPMDLVQRLVDEMGDEPLALACASSKGRTHPVVAIWPVALAGPLRKAMIEEDMRKIDRFTAAFPINHVNWPAEPDDPFMNINRAQDLAEAEAQLA